jgi:hypothetical protein
MARFYFLVTVDNLPRDALCHPAEVALLRRATREIPTLTEGTGMTRHAGLSGAPGARRGLCAAYR